MWTQRERERDAVRDGEIVRKETEIGEVHQREKDVAARTVRRVRAYHKMPVCEPGVSNTKTSQDYLSVSIPLCGGTLSADGGRNQGQLISGSQVGE